MKRAIQSDIQTDLEYDACRIGTGQHGHRHVFPRHSVVIEEFGMRVGIVKHFKANVCGGVMINNTHCNFTMASLAMHRVLSAAPRRVLSGKKQFSALVSLDYEYPG